MTGPQSAYARIRAIRRAIKHRVSGHGEGSPAASDAAPHPESPEAHKEPLTAGYDREPDGWATLENRR